MKVLVISHEHGLLPLAWRLVREECDVSVAVCRSRFAKAWAGKFTPVWPPSKKIGTEQLEAIEAITTEHDDTVVITDSLLWGEQLAGKVPRLYRSLPVKGPVGPLQLGGWCTGERFDGSAYLIIEDMGL